MHIKQGKKPTATFWWRLCGVYRESNNTTTKKGEVVMPLPYFLTVQNKTVKLFGSFKHTIDSFLIDYLLYLSLIVFL